MLSFSRSGNVSHPSGPQERDYEPIVISNHPPPPPKQSHKVISKYHGTKSKQSVSSSRKRGSSTEERGGWIEGGKIEVFDREVSRNALAAEERRMRAEEKVRRKEQAEGLVVAEKRLGSQARDMARQEKAEIEKVRSLVEQQRRQRERKEEEYERKVKQMERERQSLLRLQRRVEEEGIRKQHRIVREGAHIQGRNYPQDRPRCHQQQQKPSVNPNIQPSAGQFRHKQLQLLAQQRQRAMKAQTTIDYNPTVVPLLSKASYKIISTHVSTLVELLIDDMMEEQVHLLEKIELEERQHKEVRKEKEIIEDYYHQLNQFVEEAEQIQDRVGRYSTLHFADTYHPKYYPASQQSSSKWQLTEERYCQLTGVDHDTADNIEERKDRFQKYVRNFDEYKKDHLAMFDKLKEEIIEEAIDRLARELDRGSGDFVELIFRKEFE